MNQIRTPRYLSFASLFMIGFPAFYFVFAVLIFELNSKGILLILLSPLFYLSSFFWVITGLGIRQMKHWSWGTFLAALFFTTYLNALNLVNYSESQTKGLAFIATLLIEGYVYLSISRHLRVPYLFPKIKWWESGLAAMHHLPIEVFHVSSPTGTSMGQILDLSPKGCFLKSPYEFEPFEKVKIRIETANQHIDIPGVVVWQSRSTVTHPKGIGIQFGELDRKKRGRLRVLARRFEKNREEKRVISPVPTGPEPSAPRASDLKPALEAALSTELNP